MSFLEKIGQAASGAVEKVTEKTRRSAALNRLRTVISAQEKAADKEYLALGRYYYNNLRDSKDPLTEAHCAELDKVHEKLDKALTALEDFYQYDGPADAFFAEEGEREEVTVEDVQHFDFDPSQAIESVKEAAGKAAEAAAPVIDGIKEKAAPIIDAAKEKAAPVIDEIKEKAAPIVDAAKEKAAPVIDGIKGKAAPVVETVKEKISGAGKDLEKAAEETGEVVEKAEEAVEEVAKTAQEAARETEAKLYSKIEPKVEKAAEAAEPGENDDLPFEG